MVQVFNEKPNWNRRSRIDNKAEGYTPRGAKFLIKCFIINVK